MRHDQFHMRATINCNPSSSYNISRGRSAAELSTRTSSGLPNLPNVHVCFVAFALSSKLSLTTLFYHITTRCTTVCRCKVYWLDPAAAPVTSPGPKGKTVTQLKTVRTPFLYPPAWSYLPKGPWWECHFTARAVIGVDGTTISALSLSLSLARSLARSLSLSYICRVY